jgi:hypothetical protein
MKDPGPHTMPHKVDMYQTGVILNIGRDHTPVTDNGKTEIRTDRDPILAIETGIDKGTILETEIGMHRETALATRTEADREVTLVTEIGTRPSQIPSQRSL